MRQWIARYAWFMAGIFINSFGIAFITKSALGTSQISSVPYVLSLKFPPTLGVFTFVVNMIFILLQVALLRKDFHPLQFLQILVNLAFSAFIDVSMNLLSFFQPQGLPLQLFSLFLGCAILAFGISVEVAPNALVVPGEGIVKALATVSRKPFGTVKIYFDVTLIIIASILSFAFFGHLSGVGLGTVVSALLVGRLVNLCNRHIPLIHKIADLATPAPQVEAIAE
jgi:uncharacterized membrane protein YczE